MNIKQGFFLSATALANDITLFFNAFLFFSFQKTGTLMWIDYVPWLLLGVFLMFVNKWFLMKPRKLLSIVVLNALTAALLIFTGVKFLFHMQGAIPYIFGVVFLIYTVCRAAFLALNPIKENQIFIYTEFSVLGAGFFFFTQVGYFNLPVAFNLPCMFSVALNIVALIWIRIFGENSKVTSVSKWQGNFTIIALVALIGGLMLSFFLFLSDPLRMFLLKVIALTFGILRWIGFQIGRFILFLLSLFAHDDMNIPFIMENNNNMNQGENLEEMPINFIEWLLILAGLAVLTLLVIIVIKYWKKLSGGFVSISFGKRTSEMNSAGIFQVLMKHIKNLIRRVKFWITFLRCRNTPEGVYILIEFWGKRKGILRKKFETPGAYLTRVAYENLKEDLIITLILKLIGQLEGKLYGEKWEEANCDACLSKAEIKELVSYFSIKKLKAFGG